MADENKIDEEFESEIYTLTDENGEENQFELIGTTELDGSTYMAMPPVNEEPAEYVILRLTKDENGEEILETIEDDDEFDRVADVFDDMFFSEEDYDN